MNSTADWTDSLLYFVPAVLAVMGMFMLVRRFTESQLSLLRKLLERDLQLKAADDRLRKQLDAMPLKLQAYERLILFMERISPDSLLVRVHTGNVNAQLLQVELLATIRAEFEHNLSQQLYVSEDSWTAVCQAKDAMVTLVMEASRRVGASATGVQLGAVIFESTAADQPLATRAAILILKQEAQRLFS